MKEGLQFPQAHRAGQRPPYPAAPAHVLYENAVYKIMDARDCAGRADQLEAEYAGIRGF